MVPRTPKKLYVYFSGGNLPSIKANGLIPKTSGKVWATDMPPTQFNSFRLGGSTGINFIKSFPFFASFAKSYDYVAEIDDVSSFQPAALSYKQLLGQYESSATITPDKLKIRASGN
jgi:hypothetical protein